ncbi:hypothetical protein SKAU_G00202840 [Synaphobranchus kaupii]|uniref:Uncharacterized protein n=1 Tax=Synaphobranchus kaupii TaxID=118154 RepID=A0A9Q1IYJ5_SYNKA|nr:hypothetical protein SKAU_G00202840 [Synaphobranchus kaupii]
MSKFEHGAGGLAGMEVCGMETRHRNKRSGGKRADSHNEHLLIASLNVRGRDAVCPVTRFGVILVSLCEETQRGPAFKPSHIHQREKAAQSPRRRRSVSTVINKATKRHRYKPQKQRTKRSDRLPRQGRDKVSGTRFSFRWDFGA